MKKRSFPRFFLIFCGALALLFLLTLGVLWVVLLRFQNSQDALETAEAESRAPQLAFEKFVAEATPEYWAQQWQAARTESYDTLENVAAEMERLLAGDSCKLYKAESYTDETPVYALYSADIPIANVTMTGKGASWSADTITMRLEGDCSGSVIAPEGAVVLCNGQALDPLSASPEPSQYDLNGYEDALTGTVSWLRYEVSGQLLEPEFSALPPEGKKLSLLDGRYCYVLDEQSAEPYRVKGENFAQALATYYMMGSFSTGWHMSRALAYVQHSSPAYETIYGAYNGVSWGTPYGNATYDIQAGEPVVLADNCMSLDIAFRAEGSFGQYTNKVEGVYRVYYIDSGSGYEICGLFSS